MKSIFVVFFALLVLPDSEAQNVSSFRLDGIRKKIFSDSLGYIQLLKRYTATDTSLTYSDYMLLYYGQLCRPHFHKNNRFREEQLQKLVSEDKAEEAYTLCLEILKENPVSLFPLQTILNVSDVVKLTPQEIDSCIFKLTQLLQTIHLSGNGNCPETAFQVICRQDEYLFMRNCLDIDLNQVSKPVSKKTDFGYCDKFRIVPTENYRLTDLYFLIPTEKRK